MALNDLQPFDTHCLWSYDVRLSIFRHRKSRDEQISVQKRPNLVQKRPNLTLVELWSSFSVEKRIQINLRSEDFWRFFLLNISSYRHFYSVMSPSVKIIILRSRPTDESREGKLLSSFSFFRSFFFPSVSDEDDDDDDGSRGRVSNIHFSVQIFLRHRPTIDTMRRGEERNLFFQVNWLSFSTNVAILSTASQWWKI